MSDNWDDTVLPFQLDHADVRGRVARLDRSLQKILAQHDYPTVVAGLVAEAALLTALIGETMKLRWKLSLQIRGDGPVRLIATDFYAPAAEGEPARIRAYASFDADRLDGPGAAYRKIGKGMFAILIDQGEGMTPYQGITPLVGTSLADCAETYFAQSEQLPTRFALTVGEAVGENGKPEWRAGAIMLQHMPKASPFAKDDATGEGGLLAPGDLVHGEDAENWSRATMHLETTEATELIGPHVTMETLLVRLFHQEAPRVFDPLPVSFGCTCGPEKVVQTMSIYSAKDIGHMTTDDGKVTADCQFCGAHYEFDPSELGFEGSRAKDD